MAKTPQFLFSFEISSPDKDYSSLFMKYLLEIFNSSLIWMYKLQIHLYALWKNTAVTSINNLHMHSTHTQTYLQILCNSSTSYLSIPLSSAITNFMKSPTLCRYGWRINSHVSLLEGSGTHNTGYPCLMDTDTVHKYIHRLNTQIQIKFI